MLHTITNIVEGGTMKCLIIAAGRGSRLRGNGTPKPLTPLNGKPIIQHIMERALQGGVTEFVVVTGFRSEEMTSFLAELGRELSVPITTVHNPEWQRGNGISVLAGRPYLVEPFILLMADHIFSPDILSDLISRDQGPDEVTLAVDGGITGNPWVDLEDVTRVLDENGFIRRIGKHLPEYTCFDTGMFKCSPSLFHALEESVTSTGNESLSGAMEILAGRNRARTFDIRGRFWIDIDTDEMYQRAKSYLGRPREQRMS